MADGSWLDDWEPRLRALADRLARVAADALAEPGAQAELARPMHEGAGDTSFGLDVRCEAAALAWLAEVAASLPLSLLTEDRGWLHRGPAAVGGSRELDGFDHGGPRIALDPVDGTRNLMNDLRSAWSVVAAAGPGADEPRLADVRYGLVAELSTSRESRRRVLSARRGGPCRLELRARDGRTLRAGELTTDDDDRPDHGYFPFFRFRPEERPAIAAIEAVFFERLARDEGAAIETCFDDQYITSGGQLVLLALGTYRMVCDLRGTVAAAQGRSTITTKPYDVAGAIVVAESAGCVVTDPRGRPLDFPLDTHTPVAFVAWTNARTRARLEPHLEAALQAMRSSASGSAPA